MQSAAKVYASCLVLILVLLPACREGARLAPRGVKGPVSGGLVFIRQVDGQSDLARARIADGAVGIVASTPEREERWPYWSELARRVVFPARAYGANIRTDLVLWDPESGEERIVESTPERDERWPTWSPVAPRFAYAFKERQHPSGIAIYDVVTDSIRIVATIAFPGSFLRPAFSPDGQRLVVQRRSGGRPEAELWLLEAGRARRLTSQPEAIDAKARFTRDGRAILFTRRSGVGAQADLLRLDLATGSQELFASLPTSNEHSSWPSPTRDEVAFVSDRDGSNDIFLVDVHGGAPRNLTRSPEKDEGVPLWSPDGERLVVLRTPRTESGQHFAAGESRLSVIDREGRELFETAGIMADWMPAWPD
jgi:Tol biopolymer transport system component